MAQQQANGVAKGATSQAQSVPGAGGLQEKVQGATKGILSSIEGFGGWAMSKGSQLLDRVFPPEQRASLLAKLQSFMLSNPKLSVSRLPPTIARGKEQCVLTNVCVN